MNAKRKIEIFSTGCPACEAAIVRIRDIACPSCDVVVLDMNEPDVAKRAEGLGMRSVPSVLIEGVLAECCAGRGPDESVLRSAGLGQPLG